MDGIIRSHVFGDIYDDVLDLLDEKANLFFEYRKSHDNGDYGYKNRDFADDIFELQKILDVIYGIETGATFRNKPRKLNYLHNKINDLINEKLVDIMDEKGNYKPREYYDL